MRNIVLVLTESGGGLGAAGVAALAAGGVPDAHGAPGAVVPPPAHGALAPAARRPPLSLRVAAEPRSRTHQIHLIRRRGLHRYNQPEISRFAVERKASAVFREH